MSSVDYLNALNSKGSGLNITQIVDSLVDAEKTPQKEMIETKISENNTSISAIAEIKNSLSTLSTSLKSLVGNTSLKPSSNSTSISVELTNPSKANTLDSSITVSSLATGQTLAFTGYASSETVVGGGTLVFERGDWSSGSFVASSTVSSKSLTVLSTDTLASLRDKINSLSYDVTASIVGAGDGTYNLVLKSSTGVGNALRVTATESPVGSGLSSIDNTTTNGTKQKIAGSDAAINVDGMSLTRTTNIIDDLFEGYTVNLINTTSSSAKLTSTVDTTTAKTNLQALVDSVNKLKTVLNNKTFRGSASAEPGELASDPAVRSLKNQIENNIKSSLTGFGADGVYLSNLGVRTNKDGTLSLNSRILETELKNNPSSLDAIFNSMYSSSSSLLSISGGNSKTPTPGSFTFAMTAYVAGSLTGLVDTDTTPQVTSSDNTIQLTVDGTTSGTITVPSSHYSSQGALATAVQTAINSDSNLTAAGKSVSVSFVNGSYNITSVTKGASSSIALNSIGSNLDSFFKMSGSADTDNIGSTQSGTANTALTLNGSAVTATDTDGLVDAETLGGSGNFSIDGAQSGIAGSSLNSHITISSSNNLSSRTFTITGTSVTGTSLTETITGPTASGTVTTTNLFKTVTQISSDGAASSVNVGTAAAFADTTGKRASVTSAGGDESDKSFTIVGTDMSGNAQTEVITGPSASSTVIGTKTFRTIQSITPNSNTTGSVTLGFSGVGITTTGVTGSASIDNVAMTADIENNIFTSISGNSIGIKVKYTGSGANATIFYGDSFIDRMTNYIDEILNSSNSILTNRVTRLNKEVSNQNVQLSDLNTQFESIRSRYVSQFTAMEKAVTSLKSTGEYLTNLFEAMNKDD